MSIRRMMLFTLGAKIKNIIEAFKTRVLADFGLFEAESCLDGQLTELDNDNLFDSASLIVTPNGYKAGKLYSIVPTNGTGDLTVTRATTATRVNSLGLIENVAINVPRIDYSNGSCPSILVEPQRTNLIRNSTMQGAVVGTPGTLPTNWQLFVLSGLTTSVVGLGVEKGINYIDLKISGTATGTVYVYRMQSDTSVVGSLNQSWTISTYFKKIQNNLPNGFGINIVGRTSSSGFSETIATNTIQNSMTTELLRYTASGVVLNSNTVYIDTTVRFDTIIGQTYDFTFRVAAPQFELGANATSYIPTTTTSVTRNADVISNTNASTLIGQTEGTIFIDANLQGVSFSDNVSKVLCNINLNNTVQNRITIYRYNNLLYYDNIVNGNYQGVDSFFTITNFIGKIKLTLTYQQNNVKVFVNGALRNTDTSALIPTCNTFNIGSGHSNAQQWNGTINNVLLWKTALTDAQAIQLTTL